MFLLHEKLADVRSPHESAHQVSALEVQAFDGARDEADEGRDALFVSRIPRLYSIVFSPNKS